MADFFSNLLLRSSASVKTSGAVLQPRLPSLFETTRGGDEFPTPPADTALRESIAPGHAENSSHLPEQNRQQNTDLPSQPSMQRAAPPDHRPALKPQLENEPGPAVASTVHENPSGPTGTRLPERHFRAPDQTVRAAREAQEAPVFGTQAVTVEPRPTVLSAIEREASTINSRPVARTDSLPPVLQGNGQTPQVESRLTNAQQPEGRLSFRAEQVARPVAENHPVVVGATRPDLTIALPGNAPLLTAMPVRGRAGRPHPQNHSATQAQPGNEQESVVQIHIGRIEVRAVTPPAAPRVTQAAASQPKLSLDDYLRQREEKR